MSNTSGKTLFSVKKVNKKLLVTATALVFLLGMFNVQTASASTELEALTLEEAVLAGIKGLYREYSDKTGGFIDYSLAGTPGARPTWQLQLDALEVLQLVNNGKTALTAG